MLTAQKKNEALQKENLQLRKESADIMLDFMRIIKSAENAIARSNRTIGDK